MTRKLNVVLLALLVLVAAPFAWLMLDASTGSVADKPVTIAQLRGLAASVPGVLPSDVRYEVIGHRYFVSDLLAAGSGLRPTRFVIRAYELAVPGAAPITIDRGMSRWLAQDNRVRGFDPLAQAAVERATRAASVALVLAPSLQHAGDATAMLMRGAARAASDRSLAPYAVAPGVVVIPAIGMRHGVRMIFVKLSNGHELLFTGDVAPVRASWQQLRPPARLITSVFLRDNRAEIAAWLRAVDSLRQAAPDLHVVSGHDPIIPGILIHGFLRDPADALPDHG